MSHLVSKQQAVQITKEIEAEVAAIFEKHGFDAPTLKTTYGDMYALKVESTPVEKNEAGINLNSPEAKSYLQDASWNPKLSESALGREFTVRGKTFVFLGSVPTRPKYPYVAKDADGRTYKFARDIERFLGEEVSA